MKSLTIKYRGQELIIDNIDSLIELEFDGFRDKKHEMVLNVGHFLQMLYECLDSAPIIASLEPRK